MAQVILDAILRKPSKFAAWIKGTACTVATSGRGGSSAQPPHEADTRRLSSENLAVEPIQRGIPNQQGVVPIDTLALGCLFGGNIKKPGVTVLRSLANSTSRKAVVAGDV